MTAYSDFPPPAHFANFMHNRKMLEYLCAYAEHFDLIKHIKFGCKVEKIERATEYTLRGTWVVTYKNE